MQWESRKNDKKAEELSTDAFSLVTYMALDRSLNHSGPCQILVLSVKMSSWGEKREKRWMLSNTVPVVS